MNLVQCQLFCGHSFDINHIKYNQSIYTFHLLNTCKKSYLMKNENFRICITNNQIDIVYSSNLENHCFDCKKYSLKSFDDDSIILNNFNGNEKINIIKKKANNEDSMIDYSSMNRVVKSKKSKNVIIKEENNSSTNSLHEDSML